MKKLLVAAFAALAIFASTAQAVVAPRQPGLYFEEVEQPAVTSLAPGELHPFQRVQITAVGDSHYLPNIYVGADGAGGGIEAISGIVVLDEDTMKPIGLTQVNQEGKGVLSKVAGVGNFWASIPLLSEFIHAEQTRTFLICANINSNVYNVAPASVSVYYSGFNHWSYSGQNEEFGSYPTSQQHPITKDPYWVGYVQKNFGADLGLGGTLATGRWGKVASWGFVFPNGKSYEALYLPFMVNISLPPNLKSGSLTFLLRDGNKKIVSKLIKMYVFQGMTTLRGEFKVTDPKGQSIVMIRGVNYSVEMTAGPTTKGVIVNVGLDEKNLIIYEKASNRILSLSEYNNNFGPPALIGLPRKGYSVIPAVK